MSGTRREFVEGGVPMLGVLNGIAVAEGVTMRDGTVQFEMRGAPGLLAGIAFHMQSAADYEIVYFVADAGGEWRSAQYQPVFEGATTWQHYPDPTYLAELASGPRADGWTRVRLETAGARFRVWLGDGAAPVLDVPATQRPIAAGSVGIWSVSPRGNTAALAQGELAVRAFEMRPATGARLPKARAVAREPRAIRDWQITGRLAAPDSGTPLHSLPESVLHAPAAWRPATPEPNGLVNLNRAIGNAGGPQTSNVFGGSGRGMALAGTIVEATRVETRRLELGYSDEVSVFLDGVLLYSGDNALGAPGRALSGRSGRGRVVFENASIDVPLTPGLHELVLAVTDKAFGWGFKARWAR
jgi:hypothetical protein